MDPEENYRQQKELYGSKDPRDKARLRELVAALRGWVAAGGFKPKGFVGAAWKPTKPLKVGASVKYTVRLGGEGGESGFEFGKVKEVHSEGKSVVAYTITVRNHGSSTKFYRDVRVSATRVSSR